MTGVPSGIPLSETLRQQSAAVVLGILVAVALPVHAGPRLVCKEPVYDFGAVQNRDSIDHVFLLRNEGDADLIVEQVSTSCGCTTTKLSKQTIPPGETVELASLLSLKGRKGKQDKAIHVRSNDPQSPDFTLRLVGDVTQDLDLLPDNVFFGQSAEELAQEKSVRIVSDTGKMFHITGVETNEGRFLSAALETVREGQEYRLKVELTPETKLTSGSYNGKIILHTDNPQYPRMEIPVVAYVQKELIVVPRELLLVGSASGGEPLSRQFFVRSRSNRPLEILGVDVPIEGAQVSTEKFQAWDYRIAISRFQFSRDLDGKTIRIRVRDADGKAGTLDVPIRVR